MKKIIVISLFLLFANSAFGAGDYLYKNFDVDITINSDSTFDVIENQTYLLNGNFGYFYRDIEFNRLDHISNIEVFDNGNKINATISNKGNMAHIQWDFPRRDFYNEEKSWTIKYKVHGGLGFYKDYDELYWNAVFADRTVLVENAKVIVHLPYNALSLETYEGAYGSKLQNTNYRMIDEKTAEFLAKDIPAGEYFTIVATWPKGFVKKPFLYRNQIMNLGFLFLAILIPLIVFIRSYSIWNKKGKDVKINKTIIAQYDPPNNISPALMGVLIKQNASIKEILATIIDLSVRGYVKITEIESGFSVFKSKDYRFDKAREFEGLKEYEKEILDSIFCGSDSVLMSSLKNEFYKKIPGLKKLIFNEVEKTRYFDENISKKRMKYALPYILFAFIGCFILIFLTVIFGFFGLFILLISVAISAVIGILFGYYMPVLTDIGAEAKWHALGFKEYLHTAERFRIGAETLETFSKFLPFAMVFGVEKQWANRFSDFSFQAGSPGLSWYAMGAGSSHSFSATDFSSSFSSFSSSVSSAFASSPSGSGGGGGAGGGGGGGGGGAG